MACRSFSQASSKSAIFVVRSYLSSKRDARLFNSPACSDGYELGMRSTACR